MLKNVKSSYFIRVIFSFMDEKKKLKLIKYNKSLKENMNIRLVNYKIFSGKYIIYEQNGKGKEYNYFGELRFEGEYLNGERNGKGKEYDYFGKLEFEGEYLNGKRKGKGKDYYYDGTLSFEGKYLDNERWKGILYDFNGNIIYELNKKNNIVKEYDHQGILLSEYEYLNIKRNGKGKGYQFDGKLKFEVEYLNGLANGKGKEYYFNGKLKFEGEYLNGKRWKGKGYDKLNNIVYELKEGKGFIKEYDFNGVL